MEEIQIINKAIQKSFAVCCRHRNIMVSLSGGADSDDMLDLLLRTCEDKYKLKFVWFNTGIEYNATKEHLNLLEKKYNIKIDRQMAKVPVPLGCKTYGQPFLSKFVSQMIERLQKKNFDFKNDGNKSFEELKQKYKDCEGALTWWCNQYHEQEGKKSHFNISNNRWLKEFMIENPPTFNISDKCCLGAKKNTSHDYEKQYDFDLKCVGLRKAEGGIRSSAYKNCYEFDSAKKMQSFRPIWHFSDNDKKTYEKLYNIEHSKCYTEYGFKRTGCCGCPFNSKFEDDLKIIKDREPQLYIAVNNIFKDSYQYTRNYRLFKTKMERGKRQAKGQISIDEILSDFGEENDWDE